MAGSYSLNPNSWKCDDCPPNSLCTGGDLIQVESGFW